MLRNMLSHAGEIRLNASYLNKIWKELCIQYKDHSDGHAKAELEYINHVQKLIYKHSSRDGQQAADLYEQLSVFFEEVKNFFLVSRTKKSQVWFDAHSGQTVFHAVAAAGSVPVLQRLLADAKIAIKLEHLTQLLNRSDASGKTALDYAAPGGEIYHLLAAQGAKKFEALRAPVNASHSRREKKRTASQSNESSGNSSGAEKEGVPHSLKRQKTHHDGGLSVSHLGVFRRQSLFHFEQEEDYYSAEASDSKNAQSIAPVRGPDISGQVVVLYRGITFLQTDYDTSEKQALKTADRTTQDLLSEGVSYLVQNAGMTVNAAVQSVRQRFGRLTPDIRDKMLELYVKDCAEYQALQRSEAAVNGSKWFQDARTPYRELISLDLSASTACGYALGLISGSSIKTANRQFVHYDQDGRPHHRHAGVLLVVAQPVDEWHESYMYYVRRLWAQKRIAVDYFKSVGNEVIISAGLSQNNIVMQKPLIMPDFSKPWQHMYHGWYGCSEKKYNEIADSFRKYAKDPVPFRRQLLEKKILDHLRHYAAKTVEENISQMFSGRRVYPSATEGQFSDRVFSHEEARQLRSGMEIDVEFSNASEEGSECQDVESVETPESRFKQGMKLLMQNKLIQAEAVFCELAGVPGAPQDYEYALTQTRALLHNHQETPKQQSQEGVAQVGASVMPVRAFRPLAPTYEDLRAFANELKSVSINAKDYFHVDANHSSVCKLSNTLLCNPQFFSNWAGFLNDTHPAHAEKWAWGMRYAEIILTFHLSSLCLMYFEIRNYENHHYDDYMKNFMHCNEVISVFKHYIRMRKEVEQWLQAVNNHPETPRLMHYLVEARQTLVNFTDSEIRRNQLVSVAVQVWTFLFNMTAEFQDDIELINEPSDSQISIYLTLLDDITHILRALYVADPLEIDHEINSESSAKINKKNLDEWDEKQENLADALGEYLDESTDISFERELIIRQGIIRIYENILSVSPVNNRSRIGELKLAIVSQLSDLVRLYGLMGDKHDAEEQCAIMCDLCSELNELGYMTVLQAQKAEEFLNNALRQVNGIDEQNNRMRPRF